jgi:hypothetical protein
VRSARPESALVTHAVGTASNFDLHSDAALDYQGVVMRNRKRGRSALFAVALAFFATQALAEVATVTARTDVSTTEPPRLPIAVAQRPITLPRLVLAPHFDFAVPHDVDGTGAYLDGTSAFGITDDFEVRALFLPLQLAAPFNGGVQYGETFRVVGPGVGASYRFVRGRFELGIGVDARVYTIPNTTGFTVAPTVPLRFHATDAVRIDLTPTIEFVHYSAKSGYAAFGNAGVILPAGDVTETRLFLPVKFVYNITESVHLGANSGVTIYYLDRPGDLTGVPLGVFGGYAMGSATGPLVDVDPYFTFPYFFATHQKFGMNTTDWVIGLNVTGHLYF